MNGGTVSGNTATEGGGVYVAGTLPDFQSNPTQTGSTFTMNGGTISGNKSTASGPGGGGVFVQDGGTFKMKGGFISGNEAAYHGGGVFIENYIIASPGFEKTGGVIYGANAPTEDLKNKAGSGSAALRYWYIDGYDSYDDGKFPNTIGSNESQPTPSISP
jgi:hypothetical protein